jgi:ribosome-associated protein
MELQKLQRVVVDALEDVKAHDIKVYNTVGLSDMFDRVILASGTSNRQTRALAWHVVEKVKAAGGHVVSVEGADAGEWVLVDLGDVVVQYYELEEIWGSKPLRVKLGEPAPRRGVAAPGSKPRPATGTAERAPTQVRVGRRKPTTRAGATASGAARPARAAPAARQVAKTTASQKSRSAGTSGGLGNATVRSSATTRRPGLRKAAAKSAPRSGPKSAPKSTPKIGLKPASTARAKAPAKSTRPNASAVPRKGAGAVRTAKRPAKRGAR